MNKMILYLHLQLDLSIGITGKIIFEILTVAFKLHFVSLIAINKIFELYYKILTAKKNYNQLNNFFYKCMVSYYYF